MPIAFNPTVSSIQTETPYLSQNHAVEDPLSKRDVSPSEKSIKKTALQLGKQAWSMFHNKIIPLMAGTYLMPGVEQYKGKGVDMTYRTRNPSTVAMYEKSRTSISLDQGIPEKAKQQWVEDISANSKERKFSFGLPVMENIPVIEGIAIEPIEYYKKDMSVKGNPDAPEASGVMVRDFAETDHAVPQNEHVQLELVEDSDDIEEFDRVEQSQDYMAERAADKAKLGEMMNKLPTVLEQQEAADNENIPLTLILPNPPKSPLSRSPVAKLPLGTNHLQKTKGPLAIRNPDSQRKSVERDVHLSVPSDHSSQPGLRNWSQATTILGSDKGVALDFDKPERKESVPPGRTSNWLKNVPLSKSWKQKRETAQQQKHGAYVDSDPFQQYVDASIEAKDEKDAKKGNEKLRSSLRNWIPFQHKKQEVDSDGFSYEASSDESPIRGRPRQRVQHPGTKRLEVV